MNALRYQRDVEVARDALAGAPHALAQVVALIERVAGKVVNAQQFQADMHLDLRQQACEALLGTNGKLAEYGGKGSLESWLKVVLLRMLIDSSRRVHREIPVEVEALTANAAPEDGPEISIAKARHREVVKRAFAAAVQQLPVFERRLLRAHYFHGQTFDAIAAELGLHRITVARKMSASRQLLADAVRAQLAAELALPRCEIEALDRALLSSFDLSVSRVFQAASGSQA